MPKALFTVITVILRKQQEKKHDPISNHSDVSPSAGHIITGPYISFSPHYFFTPNSMTPLLKHFDGLLIITKRGQSSIKKNYSLCMDTAPCAWQQCSIANSEGVNRSHEGRVWSDALTPSWIPPNFWSLLGSVLLNCSEGLSPTLSEEKNEIVCFV